MDWVRLYHDMPADPKWRVIAKKAGQRIGDVIAVYTFVLCNGSSNAVKRGVTHGFVAEDVAAAIDVQEGDVIAILDAMEGKVLKNGQLLGWEKRNPIREDCSTERVRKHRETVRNAMKPPETEEETDKKTPSLRSGVAPAVPTLPKPVRRQSTSLPEGFPGGPEIEAAREYWQRKGRLDLDSDDEIQKFRAHHSAHGKRMADWSGAWVTWYSNSVRFNDPPGGKTPPAAKILKVA